MKNSNVPQFLKDNKHTASSAYSTLVMYLVRTSRSLMAVRSAFSASSTLHCKPSFSFSTCCNCRLTVELRPLVALIPTWPQINPKIGNKTIFFPCLGVREQFNTMFGNMWGRLRFRHFAVSRQKKIYYTKSRLQWVLLQWAPGYYEQIIYCRASAVSLTTMSKWSVTMGTRLLRAHFVHQTARCKRDPLYL